MLPLLRALTFLPLILASSVRRHERRLVRSLRGRGALDRANAVTIEEGRPVGRWVQQRLVRGGAIGEAGNGRYYLSEPGYAAYRSRRRRRAAIVLIVFLAGLAIAFYSGVVSL